MAESHPAHAHKQMAHAHGTPPHDTGLPKVAGIPKIEEKPLDLEPLEVAELEPAEQEQDDNSGGASKIRAFGVAHGHVSKEFKRETAKTGTGACRVKSFHGRLSDQGLGYLDDSINEWLDKHPEIEVKFVTSNVGVFEGKIREPALVLNLWY